MSSRRAPSVGKMVAERAHVVGRGNPSVRAGGRELPGGLLRQAERLDVLIENRNHAATGELLVAFVQRKR